MDDAVLIHRLHFGFTAAYHYIFPQLTMGLALLIVILKGLALRRGDALSTARHGSGPRSSPSASPWRS